jgi:hypothetical protein
MTRLEIYESARWHLSSDWEAIKICLEPVKFFIYHVYSSYLKSNYYAFVLILLTVLWFHLIVWLLLDVTVLGVTYINSKQSFLDSEHLKKGNAVSLSQVKLSVLRANYKHTLYSLYI